MNQAENGFTLIELAIVLVIIGLLIGGVLFGKDMIAASEVRATVSQLDKFRSAVNAFRLKYNELPGDMRPSKAAQFGFFQITGNCGTTCLFANQLIDANGPPSFIQEYLVFWRHLSQAGLIETLDSNLLRASDGESSSQPEGYENGLMPKSKMGHYWYVTPSYRFATDGSSSVIGGNDFFTWDYLSPVQAFGLDNKIDDGKPNSGKTVDMQGPEWGYWAATGQDGNCTYGGTDQYAREALYNIDPATGGSTGGACRLSINAGF